MQKNVFLLLVLGSILFSVTTMFLGNVADTSKYTALGQSTNNNNNNISQEAILEQLISNLTQAKTNAANNNTSAAATTSQLTAIIGELSDILGKVTTDNNGQHLDTHTHYFTHNDHAHTVTHTHPHSSDHHGHNTDWFDRHHIFNPKDCKPGLMC